MDCVGDSSSEVDQPRMYPDPSCVPPPQSRVWCRPPAGRTYIGDVIVLQIWALIQLALLPEAGDF